LLGELVFPADQDPRHPALTRDHDAIGQRQSVADLGRRDDEGAVGVGELRAAAVSRGRRTAPSAPVTVSSEANVRFSRMAKSATRLPGSRLPGTSPTPIFRAVAGDIDRTGVPPTSRCSV
jgi:hypothetical protein